MAVCQALPVDGIGEHVVVVRGDKDLSDAAGLLFVVNPDGLSFVPEHVKRPTSINRGQADAITTILHQAVIFGLTLNDGLDRDFGAKDTVLDGHIVSGHGDAKRHHHGDDEGCQRKGEQVAGAEQVRRRLTMPSVQSVLPHQG